MKAFQVIGSMTVGAAIGAVASAALVAHAQPVQGPAGTWAFVVDQRAGEIGWLVDTRTGHLLNCVDAPGPGDPHGWQCQ